MSTKHKPIRNAPTKKISRPMLLPDFSRMQLGSAPIVPKRLKQANPRDLEISFCLLLRGFIHDADIVMWREERINPIVYRRVFFDLGTGSHADREFR